MTDPAEATTWNNPDLERLLLRYGSGPARGEYDDLLKERDRLRALADPAPVGLSEDERELVEDARAEHSAYWIRLQHPKLLAIIDRLSAAPVDDRERVPEGWRVEWRRHLIPETSMFVSGRTSQYEDRPYLVPVSPSVDPEEG